ncbi:hypothetical protein CXB51_012644 [Gossypium anomalum]|uniref:Uncharacterized protein n=1 Tax=Gossypium anomalum TaxID=47600 RepID=A0A8J5YMP6_9ROSI|nr:hypothetical protein CXB51_012644 [Gossypium anomalum]
MIAVRKVAWAKANLNHTAQALIISGEGIRAGLKAAAITGVFTVVPVLIAVRKVAWAKANLNHTAQALIISGEASN